MLGRSRRKLTGGLDDGLKTHQLGNKLSAAPLSSPCGEEEIVEPGLAVDREIRAFSRVVSGWLPHLRRAALDHVNDDIGIEQILQHCSKDLALGLLLRSPPGDETLARHLSRKEETVPDLIRRRKDPLVAYRPHRNPLPPFSLLYTLAIYKTPASSQSRKVMRPFYSLARF